MKQRLNYLARSQQRVWRKSDAEDQLIISSTSTVKLGDGSIIVLDGSLRKEGEMEKQKELETSRTQMSNVAKGFEY